MSKKDTKNEHQHLKDLVLEEYGKGNVVFASVSGLLKCECIESNHYKKNKKGLLCQEKNL